MRGVEALKKQLELAHFNSALLFDARSAEQFTEAVNLAKQATDRFALQTAGAEKAATGVAARVAVFLDPYREQLTTIDDARKKIEELKKAGEFDQADTLVTQLADQMLDLQDAAKSAQPAFERLGVYVQAAFGAGLKTGKTPMEMLGALKDAFAILKTGTGDMGLTASPTIAKLLGIQTDVEKSSGAYGALGSLTQMWSGFSDAGMMRGGKYGGFSDLGQTMAKDIVEQFKLITDQGGDFGTAMALNQPLLQQMWEAQRAGATFTDQGVLDLLAAAEAAGTVGEYQMAVETKMLEALLGIKDILAGGGGTGGPGVDQGPWMVGPGGIWGRRAPQYAAGTHGEYVDFGSGTPAWLHGRERIMTERESGGGEQTIIVQLDEQVLSRAVVRGAPRVIRVYAQ